MARVAKTYSKDSPKRSRPALTPEARENQLIAKAINLAEKQIDEGTASSQVITHFLKLGTEKAKLEQEKIRMETDMLKAKTDALQSAKHVEELYANALKAMKIYKGEDEDEY